MHQGLRRALWVAGVALTAALAAAMLRDLSLHSFSGHEVSRPPATNRSRCAAVDFEASQASVAAVNRAIDHAQHFQLCERVLSSVDPLEVERQALKPLVLTVLGATIDLSPTIRRLRLSGLKTLVPLHVNVTSPATLQVGWRSTGVVAVEATLDAAVAQRDKRWWQPCWVSPWHPSSCPPRSTRVELLVAVANASGVSEVRVDMLQCLPGGASDGCQDLSAMDLVAAVVRGRPRELLLRVFNRIDRLAMLDFALELGSVEHLRVHFSGASDWVNTLVDRAAGVLERRLNRKGAVYRAVLDGVRDGLVATANHAVGRWISPLFHGSCLDEVEDVATVFDAA